jgi:hypothetical protein
MSLDHICILHCKQCITMNEYRICWFSWFGFPEEKYLGLELCISCNESLLVMGVIVPLFLILELKKK